MADREAAMASQHTVCFGLGSNLGDRQANLVEGIQRIRAQVNVSRLSSVYETEPAYVTDQPRFLNMVVKGVTALDPHALLAFLKHIEQGMGRRGGVRYGPRPIDIDILFFDDQVIAGQDDFSLPQGQEFPGHIELVPFHLGAANAATLAFHEGV